MRLDLDAVQRILACLMGCRLEGLSLRYAHPGYLVALDAGTELVAMSLPLMKQAPMAVTRPRGPRRNTYLEEPRHDDTGNPDGCRVNNSHRDPPACRAVVLPRVRR